MAVDPATILHAAVSAFAAFACGAIVRAVAARPLDPGLRHARSMLVAWWTGAAVSNAAAALALSDLAAGFWGQLLILAFLAGGALSAIAMLLHLLHVFDGGTFGGALTLAVATILTTAILTLGFAGGALALPTSATTVASQRALLSASLVMHGIPTLVALGFGGLALEVRDPKDGERLTRLAGGLLVWSAAGLLATVAAMQKLELAYLAALGLAVIGTALCATYYVPANMVLRWSRPRAADRW